MPVHMHINAQKHCAETCQAHHPPPAKWSMAVDRTVKKEDAAAAAVLGCLEPSTTQSAYGPPAHPCIPFKVYFVFIDHGSVSRPDWSKRHDVQETPLIAKTAYFTRG